MRLEYSVLHRATCKVCELLDEERLFVLMKCGHLVAI